VHGRRGYQDPRRQYKKSLESFVGNKQRVDMALKMVLMALAAMACIAQSQSKRDAGAIELEASQKFGSLDPADIDYQEKYRALVIGHAAALIDYLKQNPNAKDYLSALERLQSIKDKLGEDIPGHKEFLEGRILECDRQLKLEKQDSKRFTLLTELIYLHQAAWNGDFDTMERLLWQKYEVAVRTLTRQARIEEVFGERGIGNSLLNRYLEIRDRRRGIDLTKRMIKDFGEIKEIDLRTIEAKFENMPVVGESFRLKAKGVDGMEIDSQRYAGDVVIITFWASWCEPCKKEFPQLQELFRKYQQHQVAILGVSLDKEPQAFARCVPANALDWPHYFDGKGWENEVAKKHSILQIPTMFVIDRQGILASIDPDNLLTEISSLLAK
jgi:thiol-disulfide isomerase/thioredoxin